MKTYSFEDIQNAFSSGEISLNAFAEVLGDNFGKKKTRKILRKNLEPKLKEDGMSWEERQKYLGLISLLV
jgi:hypothetical protein